MGQPKLSRGEWIIGISAILLFGLLFFPWFGVVLTNSNSSLLNLVRFRVPDKTGWDALGSAAVVPLLAVGVSLAAVWSRWAIPRRAPHVGLNAMVAALGLLSVGLILFRILDAPGFYPQSSLAPESTVRLPMFLALAAALGVAVGGLVALREEVASRPVITD